MQKLSESHVNSLMQQQNTTPPLRWTSLTSSRLTFVIDEVLDGRPGLVIAEEGGVGRQAAVEAVRRAADAFLSQVSHEQLQADEGEDAQAEDCEDHHVSELLHRLNQSPDDRLQAWWSAGGEDAGHIHT